MAHGGDIGFSDTHEHAAEPDHPSPNHLMTARLALPLPKPLPRTLMFSTRLLVTAGISLGESARARAIRTETLAYQATEVTATLREIPGYATHGNEFIS